TNGLFRYIYGIAIDSTDKIYVSDYKRGRIQVFDTDGNYLSKWSVGTSYSRGITIDGNDNVYVVNNNGDVEKYNTSGTLLQTWSGVNGAYLIAHDSSNNIYVTKYYSKRVYKYDSNGNAVNSFGGNNYFSTSYYPYGIEVDNSGNIYVGEYSGSHKVYKYDSAGNYQSSVGGYGTSLGKFEYPKAISKDTSGNIWVADYYNDRIQKVDGSEEWPGGGGSRIEQARQVIKDIVSNSTLTEGANFGLMEWNSSASMVVNISSTGASSIYSAVDSLSAGGGTYLDYAMNLASSYFLGSSSPMDTSAWCQNNLLIVISDGEWVDSTASSTAESLYNDYGIKTFVVGFTVSSSGAGAANYITLSQKGGTYADSPVFASNWQALYESISNYILQTISSNLTFSTPTIMPEVSADDHIIQSTFKYKSSHQWKGRLKKYLLDSDGFVDSEVWDAGEVLNSVAAADRKIWTVGPGLSTTGLNNFITTNIDELRIPLLENSGTTIGDTELEGLIDFVRGVDSYAEFSGGVDDEGDTIITGERWKLADIYHSRAVPVGAPSAYFSDEESTKTEAYYLYANDYYNFKNGTAGSRDSMIYVGSNGGMLHAFNSSDGSERWAFIPPSVLPNFKDMISSTANQSESIYGVDGSIVAKDIYYDSAWHTILLGGLRQGGHSYFALDVTDPDNPQHLFTFAHNKLNSQVSYWDSNGVRTDYSTSGTITSEYDFSKLGESWSEPIILRLPVGTDNAMTWTAIFGGGYNAGISTDYGAQLYVINLEDGGKIIQNIDITDDDSTNGIANSVPPTLLAITPDSSTSLQATSAPNGAVVYFGDLEGKLWKINLTDQGTLYETSKLFDAESDNTNTRYLFHQNAATLDNEGNLIQYFGSGDQQSLGDVDANIANRIYGFKSTPIMTSFPTTAMSTVADMADVSGGVCPTDTEDGWYLDLDANEKVTAKATIKNGVVYFPRYTPDETNICSSGEAKLSSH
ncbi:PilC/PilY family type IV pilus protein, partial [Rickettsiales bacterium]|nr:PilC/PilY family type IV pilus protein [Rickettsiales bacterium]